MESEGPKSESQCPTPGNNTIDCDSLHETAAYLTGCVHRCWTCRKRHVKCDERPVTCRICEEAGLGCAGYDVRLVWNAKSKGRLGNPHLGRRRIEPGVFGTCDMLL